MADNIENEEKTAEQTTQGEKTPAEATTTTSNEATQSETAKENGGTGSETTTDTDKTSAEDTPTETTTKENNTETTSKEDGTTTATGADTTSATGSPYKTTAEDKDQMLITDPALVSSELGKIVFEITPDSAAVYSDEIKTINYITRLFTYFDTLKSSWTQVVAAAKKYQTQTEDAPYPTGGGGNGTGGGSGNGGGGGGSNPPNPGEEIKITDITVDDLGILSDGLMKIAQEKGANIEEILANQKLQEDIKKALTALPITSELLDKMKDMKTEDLIQFLTNLYNGTNSDMIKLDETTQTVLVNYFNILTGGTIPFADLLSQSNSATLGDGMKAFQTVDALLEELKTKDGNTIRLNLLHIHNGYLTNTNLDENAMNLVRALNETMAKEKGVTVESLLTNGEYDEYIKDKITSIEPHFSYLSAVSNTSNSNIQTVMGKLNINANVANNENSTYPETSYEDMMNSAASNTTQNV